MVDFLILKRALRRAQDDKAGKHKDMVELSQNNPHLVGAISDLLAWQGDDSEFPYINVYGTAKHDDRGYRSDKYPSNGTAVTVASPPWRRIAELIGERPRLVKFRDDYVGQLGRFFLKRNGDSPRLLDSAVWFFRAQDLSPYMAKDSKRTFDRIVKAYGQALGLTAAEIDQLFDRSVDPA